MNRILLALLLVTSAHAQLLEDPAGDVTVEVAGGGQPVPQGTYESIDLVSLDLVETPQDLLLSLQVAGMPQCISSACPDVGALYVMFTHGKQYMVQISKPISGNTFGSLWEGEFERRLVTMPVEVDETENTFRLSIPRDVIRDPAGRPLMAGDVLTDIHAWSRGHLSTGIGNQDGSVTYLTHYRDRMGQEPARLDIITGGRGSTGAFTLDSADPFRASNGGAMTLRYDMVLQSRSDEETTVRLDAVDLPGGWGFERPNGTLTLGAKETLMFPVVITTPFGHRHGGADAFRLVAAAGEDEAWVELGIHYLDVPQPSGHHEDLYVHGATFMEPAPSINAVLGGASGAMWMHTVEDDASADGTPIQGWIGSPGNTVAHWSICLRPGLQMGLDMDLEDIGSIDASFTGERVFTDVVVSGRVLHLGPGEPLSSCFPSRYADREASVVAEIPAGAPFTVTGGRQSVRLDIVPVADNERMPYQDGAMLVIELDARYTGAGESGPGGLALEQGAHIRLPLDEYQDSRPAGLVGGPATSGIEIVDFEEPVLGKESPGLPLVGALAALLLVRRR